MIAVLIIHALAVTAGILAGHLETRRCHASHPFGWARCQRRAGHRPDHRYRRLAWH